MKALVIEKNSTEPASTSVALKIVPKPTPDEGEALVKVRLAGICRTDQELAKGYMDFTGIPGHEFVGDVVDIEPTAADWAEDLIGSRVVGEINCGCGICEWCLTGIDRHCPDRTVLGIAGRDGAFAEYVKLPIANLHVVPDKVVDTAAVFTEPIAAVLEPLEQLLVEPDSHVLVIGDGKVGLLSARVIQIHGCHVTCYGGSEKKLNILRQWGVNAVHLDEFEGAPRFDYVIEASGAPQGFQMAMQSVVPRGTIVLKSTYAGNLTLDAAPIVVNEVRVVGSRCGPFDPALNLLQQDLIPTGDLITKIYQFDQVEAAFRHAAEPDALKILLQFEC